MTVVWSGQWPPVKIWGASGGDCCKHGGVAWMGLLQALSTASAQRRIPHAEAVLTAEKAGLPETHSATEQSEQRLPATRRSRPTWLARDSARSPTAGTAAPAPPTPPRAAGVPPYQHPSPPRGRSPGSPERPRASPPCPRLPASPRTALPATALLTQVSVLGSCSETRAHCTGLVFLQWEQMPEMTPYNGPGTVPVHS